jgi:PAS domain S-box-containing protein
MRLRHKDGSWRTLEAVGSNLVHNNVVEAVIVNYRDITERKRAETEGSPIYAQAGGGCA